jgi:hypothetical protein
MNDDIEATQPMHLERDLGQVNPEFDAEPTPEPALDAAEQAAQDVRERQAQSQADLDERLAALSEATPPPADFGAEDPDLGEKVWP